MLRIIILILLIIIGLVACRKQVEERAKDRGAPEIKLPAPSEVVATEEQAVEQVPSVPRDLNQRRLESIMSKLTDSIKAIDTPVTHDLPTVSAGEAPAASVAPAASPVAVAGPLSSPVNDQYQLVYEKLKRNQDLLREGQE